VTTMATGAEELSGCPVISTGIVVVVIIAWHRDAQRENDSQSIGSHGTGCADENNRYYLDLYRVLVCF
jgi:hypothetical protein